ncbi:hypothetical protein AKO1_003681 [Acrasis kona]|uniref:RGS domain-containing protein n=1 Tax=Acrasis kona TaxID=1008807 RepID=A0AAW2Z7U9_9EUKA
MLLPPLIICSVTSTILKQYNITAAGDVFYLIFLLLMVIYFGGGVVFSCILDMYSSRYAKRVVIINNEDSDDDNEVAVIKNLLNNEALRKYIEKYCQMEFSLENILGYVDAKKMLDEPPIQKESLQHFYDEYMKSSSKTEINLPAKTVQECKRVLNEDDPSEDDILKATNLIMNGIFQNIKDTFSRFCKTKEYKEAARAMNDMRVLEKELN